MNNKINIQGKYAMQCMEMLENHAPDIYNSMLENGSLEDHLAYVQNMAENYIENCVDRYTHSDEYLNAEKKNPFEAMRMLNMTILEAEEAVYRICAASIFPDIYF